MNYLDIVVDATLSLTGSPENIGLKPEKVGTKVNPQVPKNDFGDLLWKTFVYTVYILSALCA